MLWLWLWFYPELISLENNIVLPTFQQCCDLQITALGTLAMCYNNVEVFRGSVRMRRGNSIALVSKDH